MVTNGWSSPTYVLFLPFLLGCVRGAQRLGRGRIAALLCSRCSRRRRGAARSVPQWLLARRALRRDAAACTRTRCSASPGWPCSSPCPAPTLFTARWSASPTCCSAVLERLRGAAAQLRPEDQSRRLLGLRQHLRPLPLHRHPVPVRALAAQPAGAGARAARRGAPLAMWVVGARPSSAAGCCRCRPSPAAAAARRARLAAHRPRRARRAGVLRRAAAAAHVLAARRDDHALVRLRRHRRAPTSCSCGTA